MHKRNRPLILLHIRIDVQHTRYLVLSCASPKRVGTRSEAWRGALQSFCRKLVWHRECLWPQDLPKHCLLVLEANDDLVPSKLARTMLRKTKHPCNVRSPIPVIHASKLICAYCRAAP